ncbi:MAG: MFS transporter, partial [Patescibacteria group bacterium]
VGISAAIYWVLRSVIQLPLASFLDKYDGEKDDFYALIFGIIVAGGSAVLFAFVREPWQLYLVQALHGIGFAFYFVSWPAIFSRHLDKNKVSFEWALDNTAVSVGAGVSAFFGGVIASKFGFPIVFITTGALSALAALILMIVPELLFPKKTISDGAPSKMTQL